MNARGNIHGGLEKIRLFYGHLIDINLLIMVAFLLVVKVFTTQAKKAIDMIFFTLQQDSLANNH